MLPNKHFEKNGLSPKPNAVVDAKNVSKEEYDDDYNYDDKYYDTDSNEIEDMLKTPTPAAKRESFYFFYLI